MHFVVKIDARRIVDGPSHVVSLETDENDNRFLVCNICWFKLEILKDDQWEEAIKNHIEDSHKEVSWWVYSILEVTRS